MKPEYRIGTTDDKDQLRELGILSYGQHQSSMTPENWARYSSFISNPETYTHLLNTSTCFLCEFENEIIGMAFLVSKGHPTQMFDKNWSYIRMVGVNPQFKGMGIAKKLTQMCIHHARKTGEKYIALHTSEFMDAARHIYESFGFKVVKEFSRFDKTYWIYLLETDSKHEE